MQCLLLHCSVCVTGPIFSAQLEVPCTAQRTVLHLSREPAKEMRQSTNLWWHAAGATMARWR